MENEFVKRLLKYVDDTTKELMDDPVDKLFKRIKNAKAGFPDNINTSFLCNIN